MQQSPIVITRVFNAPIAKVWSALTDKDEMKKWYFQLEAFKPEVGFQFRFTGGSEGGTQYTHVCEITEVIPGKKLTHSWRYEGLPGNSFVTWELADQGDKILLTLTHEGLETIAVNGPDFAVSSFNTGWTSIINESLRSYLEG